MKRRIALYMGILLFATVLAAAMPTVGEAAIYDDVIRLHILAPSDSAEDQALKIKVRDAVLSEYGARLSSYGDRETAEREMRRLLPDIERLAAETVALSGGDCAVTATLSREHYDRRTYEGFTMPAGEYLSLRIVLGEGAGQNWWCVLFPPLCTELAVKKEYGDSDLPVGLTPEEYELITGDGGEYRVRFKILETLSAVLNP